MQHQISTDSQIQQRIHEALARSAGIAPASIGVRVSHGVVSLNGVVAGCTQRCAAEQAVLGVAGVRAVADEIKIAGLAGRNPSETEIATSVVRVLDEETDLPRSSIGVLVQAGQVTLAGSLEHQEQRRKAERLVSRLKGVGRVMNQIEVGA